MIVVEIERPGGRLRRQAPRRVAGEGRERGEPERRASVPAACAV